MGHESPMEPWLPPDNRTACWSQNGLASSRRSDENHSERKPKALQQPRSVPSSRNGRRAQTCSTGRAGRKKNSGHRRSVFFLDSLYGTNQALACRCLRSLLVIRRFHENDASRWASRRRLALRSRNARKANITAPQAKVPVTNGSILSRESAVPG